jgi:type IV fimbrial biogenesis protein FimT
MMSPHRNRFSRSSRRQLRRAAGLTVIELMVSVMIMAIIVGLGAPAMMDFIIQSRMTSQANELLSDLSYARSEAASRGVRVALCASTNASTATANCSGSASDWPTGRIVFVDSNGDGQRDTASGSTELLLKVSPTLTGSSTLVLSLAGGGTAPGAFQFRPYGGMVGAGSPPTALAALSFKLCSNTAGKQGRTIDVAVTGRPSVTKVGC